MSSRCRPRVILVAHHANPTLTSEPLIGWRWAENLDQRVDLDVITHARNRGPIEGAGVLRGRVHYVDTERLARGINRLNDSLFPCAGSVGRLLLEGLSQRAFDRGAVRVAKGLMRERQVDVIHRISPISPRYPSRLGRVGVPFVVGPVNGGMVVPPGFERAQDALARRVMGLRGLARLLDPCGTTYGRASAILIANETTRDALPRHARGRAVVMCENAVEVERFDPVYKRRGRALELLYLGRLLPYKGVQYAIEAIAGLPPELPVRLTVVGTGSYERELMELAQERGLSKRVRFLGQIAHRLVPRCMAQSDLLVLPSIRESGGSVVLEAMAAGTPVLVADHGGPRETVPESVGHRLSCKGPAELVEELRRAICHLGRNEPRRERLARAARAHVERHYTWDAKADRALALYRALAEQPHTSTRFESADLKPAFGQAVAR